jgi:hypothetical protein
MVYNRYQNHNIYQSVRTNYITGSSPRSYEQSGGDSYKRMDSRGASVYNRHENISSGSSVNSITNSKSVGMIYGGASSNITVSSSCSSDILRSELFVISAFFYNIDIDG